jgi:hypothetical protein
VSERRRDGFGRRRPVRQFRQRDEHVDQKIFRVTIVGVGVSSEVEVRSHDRALGTTDAEKLGERLEERGLAGRVRADHRGDLSR